MVQVRCCGCSLQTGSLLIAVWIIISSIATLGLGIWGIVDLSKHAENMRWIWILVICSSAVSLLFAILLLIGVVKKKPLLLKTWMVYQCVCVFLGCIEFISLLAWGAAGSTLTRQVGSTLVDVYFLIIVYGYYAELLSGYEQIEPIIPATPSTSNAYGSA